MGDGFTEDELDIILMDMESFLESFIDVLKDIDELEIEDLPLDVFIDLEDDEILKRQDIIKKINSKRISTPS
jgi:hypothetical protein